MTGTECDSCGTSNAAGSHFCRECGLPLTGDTSPFFRAPRYTALRWQIDPMDPPPRRDRRWTLFALGGALLVVGLMLLLVALIVTTALSAAGSACGPGTPCATNSPGPWFAWASVPFLTGGAAAVVYAAWRTVGNPPS